MFLKNINSILILLFVTYLLTLVANHSISEFSLILLSERIIDVLKTNSGERTSNQKL